MSRSCQSAWFSMRGRGVAAHHAREAGDVLEAPGVALVRHRRGALLARAELLLDLAHLGARQVAELDGDLLEARGDQRERVDERGVAVALHDLGGRRLEADAEPRAHRLLHRGRQVREGADGARDLADRRLGGRAREPLAAGAASPRGSTSSLSPKVVGSAWTPWVRPMQGVCWNSSARRAQHAAHARRRPRAAARPHRGSGARARCRARRSTSCRSARSARLARRARRRWSGTRSRRGAPRASISATRAGVDARRARGSPRAPPAESTPRSASTSQTASSTSSQRA